MDILDASIAFIQSNEKLVTWRMQQESFLFLVTSPAPPTDSRSACRVYITRDFQIAFVGPRKGLQIEIHGFKKFQMSLQRFYRCLHNVGLWGKCFLGHRGILENWKQDRALSSSNNTSMVFHQHVHEQWLALHSLPRLALIDSSNMVTVNICKLATFFSQAVFVIYYL